MAYRWLYARKRHPASSINETYTARECLHLIPDCITVFLGNICIYSHVIELVTHMLDCHDLASAGHYWMMRIRGDLEVGIRNADW